MTHVGTPDDTPRRVVRLPVRDVSLIDPPQRRENGSVTRLPIPAESAPVAPPVLLMSTRSSAASGRTAADAPSAASTDRADGDDAVLALLSARLGFQAATAAAGRVSLPSLADFLA
jgi:hypothetical protein